MFIAGAHFKCASNTRKYKRFMMDHSFEFLLNNIPLPTFLVNNTGKIISCNEHANNLVATPQCESNMSIDDLFDLKNCDKLKRLLSTTENSVISNPYSATLMKTTNNKNIQVEINCKKIQSNKADLWIFVVSEIEKWTREIAELNVRATKDELTSINNRWSFFKAMDAEIAKAKRFNHSIALLLFDVDHFKDINDTYGHLIGDELLKHFTNNVTPYLRESDVFARLGGDEFALLMPQTTLNQAYEVANRIQNQVNISSFYTDGNEIELSISSGVAAISGKQINKKRLLELSDAALYKAKFSGRNKVEIEWLNTA